MPNLFRLEPQVAAGGGSIIDDEKVRELLEAMKVTESITAVGFFIHNERVFDWRDLTRMTSFGSMSTGMTSIEIAPPKVGGLARSVLRRTPRCMGGLW